MTTKSLFQEKKCVNQLPLDNSSKILQFEVKNETGHQKTFGFILSESLSDKFLQLTFGIDLLDFKNILDNVKKEIEKFIQDYNILVLNIKEANQKINESFTKIEFCDKDLDNRPKAFAVSTFKQSNLPRKIKVFCLRLLDDEMIFEFKKFYTRAKSISDDVEEVINLFANYKLLISRSLAAIIVHEIFHILTPENDPSLDTGGHSKSENHFEVLSPFENTFLFDKTGVYCNFLSYPSSDYFKIDNMKIFISDETRKLADKFLIN